MIDSHCHLDFPIFDQDREQVIRRATETGLKGLLIPGTEVQHVSRQIQIAHQFSDIYLAFGLHPYFLNDNSINDLTELRKCLEVGLSDPAIPLIALGEIGLDNVIGVDKQLQHRVFEAQVSIANELSLPVILHHRKSHNELITTLKNQRFHHGGVIHAFSGSQQEAHTYVSMGFTLGIGGSITYERAHKTKQAVLAVGAENIVLETDAPDMPVFGFQGQRNSPDKLIHVITALSNILGIRENEVVQQTTSNFQRTFKLN